MKSMRDTRIGYLARTAALVLLGIVYLALLAAVFITGTDLASDKTMQYILHITVILSAFAIFLFVDMIYSTQEKKGDASLARIFAALFIVPILIGRGIGLAVIADGTLYASGSLLNFYANVSVTRTIEMIAWTTLFPLSMLFLAKLFFKRQRSGVLACLSLLSAICCFVAFPTIATSNILFLLIGVVGWGVLLLLIAILYLLEQIKEYRKAQTGLGSSAQL